MNQHTIKTTIKRIQGFVCRKRTEGLLNPYYKITFLKKIEVQVIDKKDYRIEKAKEKIALIIPVKNEEKNLNEFLEDIESQTVAPDEIIFIDHESIDNTIDILSDFARKTKKSAVTVKRSSESSQFKKYGYATLAGNRNYAVELTESKYLVFCDVGNRYPKNFVSSMVGPMIQDAEVDLVGGIYQTHMKKLNDTLTYNWNCVNWDEFLPAFRAIAVKRELFIECNGLPEFLSYAGEDVLFDINYRKVSKKWVFNKAAKVTWIAPENRVEMSDKFYRYGEGGIENGLDRSRFQYLSDLMTNCLQLPSYMENPIFPQMYKGYLSKKTSLGELDDRREIKEIIFYFCDRHPAESVQTIRRMEELLTKDTRLVCVYRKRKKALLDREHNTYIPCDPSRFIMYKMDKINFEEILTIIEKNGSLSYLEFVVDVCNKSAATVNAMNRMRELCYKFFPDLVYV